MPGFSGLAPNRPGSLIALRILAVIATMFCARSRDGSSMRGSQGANTPITGTELEEGFWMKAMEVSRGGVAGGSVDREAGLNDRSHL